MMNKSTQSIMEDLESIVKIGVRIMWDECKIHGRMVKRFLNDEDVSRPMGLHPKGLTKIMTKRLTKVNDEERMIDTGELYEINFERNRYGYPRHIPKDINHPISSERSLDE